jgi:hypothetical protein
VSAPARGPVSTDAEFLKIARRNVRTIFASGDERLIDELTDLLVPGLRISQPDKLMQLRAFFSRSDVRKVLVR